MTTNILKQVDDLGLQLVGTCYRKGFNPERLTPEQLKELLPVVLGKVETLFGIELRVEEV